MTIEAPAAPAVPPAAAAPVPAAAPAAVAAPAASPAPAPAAPAAPAAAAPAADPAAKPANKTSILGAAAAPKEGEAKPEPQKTGAPEKYADFTLPEGIKLEAKAIEAFSAVAKGLGLSQESAQKLVSFQAQSVKAEIEGRIAAVAQQSETWANESRTQFGAAWELNFSHAAKAIESFGTPKVREILTAVGLDNHPEFVAMFARIGAKTAEGQPVDGKPAGSERVPTEKLMFDKMGPKS